MEYVVHEDPVLRSQTNHIAQIDLAPFGFSDLSEQVWLRAESDGTMSLCCVPYRAYGLALLDRVRLSEDGSHVSAVVQASGHRVLRILLTAEDGSPLLDQGVRRICAAIAEYGLLSEWTNGRYVAVDVDPHSDAEGLVSTMESIISDVGAEWEWADSSPFVT